MFGTTQYFVFCNPKERDASKTPFPEVTFEMAQEEIAKRSGFDVNMENKSRGEEKFFNISFHTCDYECFGGGGAGE